MTRPGLGTRLVMPPPGASPWEAVLREVEANVDRSGWDQPTAMFWIDWHDGTLGGMSGLGVSQLPLPDILARTAPYLLFDAMAELWRPKALPNMVAVAVVFEVWAATLDRSDSAARAAAARGGPVGGHRSGRRATRGEVAAAVGPGGVHHSRGTRRVNGPGREHP